jgi:hypothetical protein
MINDGRGRNHQFNLVFNNFELHTYLLGQRGDYYYLDSG